MKQRSGSSSLSALKLKSFSSLVKWWAAHYTRHIKGHVSLRDRYGLCVNACTDSGKSLAVWMQQIWRYGNKCRNTLPVYFPESLCERGLWVSIPDLRKIHSMKCANTLHPMGSFQLQKAPAILLQDFLKYFRPRPTSPEMETGANNWNLHWSS